LEIALAQGLYSAIVLPNIPIRLRDAVLAGLDSDFGGWLLVEDNQQKTIFQWFCNSIPARCGDLLKWRTGTPEASDKNGDEAQSK
jgi:hypothetical protein